MCERIKGVNDIKVGYVVELRDGILSMCMKYRKDTNYSADIITVFRDLLYKREEPKKMTIKQIEKQLGYKIALVSEDD